MNWRWISLAALLGALVIGYGALNRDDPSEETIETVPRSPAYYLQDAVITETRDDGSLHLQMHAQRIEQRTVNDSIYMHDVRVNYVHGPDSQWVLSADRAVRAGNSPVVQLFGDVEVRPLSAPADAALRTDALAIDTERSVAYSTRSPIRVTYGTHAMTAKEFRFDFEHERIDMAKMQGHYHAD